MSKRFERPSWRMLTQTLCIVQSSRVGCQMPLSVSSNDAGVHSNMLMVTAVMVLLLPVCLYPQKEAWHGRDGEKGWYTQGSSCLWGSHLSTCCARCGRFVARGDLSVNAQGHPFAVVVTSSPPCLCNCEVRGWYCCLIESPRMCVSSVVIGGEN